MWVYHEFCIYQHLVENKSVHMWTPAVQTHLVQGSTVFQASSFKIPSTLHPHWVHLLFPETHIHCYTLWLFRCPLFNRECLPLSFSDYWSSCILYRQLQIHLHHDIFPKHSQHNQMFLFQLVNSCPLTFQREYVQVIFFLIFKKLHSFYIYTTPKIILFHQATTSVVAICWYGSFLEI